MATSSEITPKVTCPHTNSQQKLSVISIVCRICYDGDKEEPLITPCRCKGTVAFVHKSCLEKWLAESNTTACELCHQLIKTERTPKYTSKQSLKKWFSLSMNNSGVVGRGVKGDIFVCSILTPIAILITYVCLFSSDYYNQKKFSMVPAAKWTSLSLLFMIAIMLIGYYLWIYSVIRLHARMWYNWWQRECTVQYIPPSNMNICAQCNEFISPPTNTPNSELREDRRAVTNRTNPVSEVEIHNEKLEHSKKVKSSTDSNKDSVEDEEVEEIVKNEAENKISLVKDDGVVYILNISERTQQNNHTIPREMLKPSSESLVFVTAENSSVTGYPSASLNLPICKHVLPKSFSGYNDNSLSERSSSRVLYTKNLESDSDNIYQVAPSIFRKCSLPNINKPGPSSAISHDSTISDLEVSRHFIETKVKNIITLPGPLDNDFSDPESNVEKEETNPNKVSIFTNKSTTHLPGQVLHNSPDRNQRETRINIGDGGRINSFQPDEDFDSYSLFYADSDETLV